MSSQDINRVIEELKRQQEMLMHSFNVLQKSVDDVLWYHRVGDVPRSTSSG